ncbi:MAG: hypothetical protein AB7G15_14630 [Alphaproteobacteria bacterium]
MRHLLAILGILCVSAGLAQAQEFKRYANARFGFAVDYPADLVAPLPGPANDDGRIFRSKDGRIEMTASGILNINGQDVPHLMKDAEALHADVKWSKRDRTDSSFTMVGEGRQGVVYRHTILYLSDGQEVIGSLLVTYPKGAEDAMGGIIERARDSFAASVRRRR